MGGRGSSGVLKYNHKVFESIMHLPFEFFVSRFHSHTVKGYKDLDARSNQIYYNFRRLITVQCYWQPEIGKFL
jgi:hypothetical protein